MVDDGKPARWSRLPSTWVNDKGLEKFAGGKSLAESLAALKLLLAVALHAENNAQEEIGPNQGSALMSYDRLGDMTGLSRALIAQGLRKLVAVELISIETEGHGRPNRYRLANYLNPNRWAKISNRQLYGDRRSPTAKVLNDLSCRRQNDLYAIKIYILFATLRIKKTDFCRASYETIRHYTGVPEARIRQAISLLLDARLIHATAEEKSETNSIPTRYELIGIDPE